jgi:nucleoside-diphosphate-sugar epimerase
MRVLIIGCGYVGLPLGADLVRQGHEVFGLRRSSTAERELTAVGIQPVYADITQPTDLAKLPNNFDWMVNCVAAAGGTREDYRQVYLVGTRNLLDWLSTKPPRKYVYTSSTSVYGQNDGSLVVENDRPEPASETGKVLVETEDLLLKAANEKNFPAVILRLAGIYGPQRGYWMRQFLRGEAQIEGRGDRILNMIHRYDVIGVIKAALKDAPSGRVFNVADNEPVTQLELFEWLSQRLGRPLPPTVSELSLGSRRRGVTNKRVSNSRLRDELGYEFKYPTFREGYEAELSQI